MRTYYGQAASKDRQAIVLVRDHKRPKNLAHHVRHSPTGFNWGYGGSGPSDLSRSILLDSFGTFECPDAPNECQCLNSWVEPTYQGFLADVVSKFVQEEDWKLFQGDVTDWVFDYLDGVKERVEEESGDQIPVKASS